MIKLPEIGLTFTDGDEWEAFCQSCLKIKHQQHNFKSVPADSGGDYGLDGFNSIGDAYQCYCPEKEYTDKELYEHQRDKITTDVQKLFDYQVKLRKILNGNKIKTWHFTTPLIKSKELILHCNAKENLVKSWNLDFIDDDFEIGLKDCGYFLPEIPSVIDSGKFLKPMTYPEIDFIGTEPTDQTIEDFKAVYENNTFVENGLRKNAKLFPDNPKKNYAQNIVGLTDSQIRDFIVGEDILEKWSNFNNKLYEKFVRVRNSLGKRVAKESLIPVNDNRDRLKEIENTVRTLINKEFHFLSESNKEELTAYLVSFWILECSLDFS